MNHYIVLKQPKHISLKIFIYELHNRKASPGVGGAQMFHVEA